MKFIKPAIATTLATALSLSTFSVMAEEQSPIIVTATRTAQTVDDSLASVTVITAKQIEQLQPNDIQELLTSVAGIDITISGGMGKTTSLYMRGTSSKHTLVMIDGVKIGSATLGSIAYQHIPVSQIERIEIVRGSRSSLYGSNAVGGIIQIFTKQGKGNFALNFDLGYGSHNTSKLIAGLSGKKSGTSYSLNTSLLNTDGINAYKTSDKDEDGYNNSSVNANIKHDFSDTSFLSVNVLHASGKNEYDDTFTPANVLDSNFIQHVAGINYTVAPVKNWQSTFKVSHSLDQNENFKNGAANGVFVTNKYMSSWQNDITLSDAFILTAGVDYLNDKIKSSSTVYDKTSRDNTGYFVQQQWLGESNDIVAALRVDNNQTFGNHTTGNIAWGHDFAKAIKLIASYGTAFKTPTFNDLYWPSAGDPNLKPEKSKTTEIELRKTHSWGKASMSLYNTQIENLISGWPPKNVNKAEINGFEMRFNTSIAGWDTRVELALLDPRDKVSNKILQRRTQKTVRIDTDKSIGKWTMGASYIEQGHRYNDTSNATKIDGYSIVNLRVGYSFNKKLKLKSRIENLFDKEYETASKYNNPGLGLYVGLQYQGF